MRDDQPHRSSSAADCVPAAAAGAGRTTEDSCRAKRRPPGTHLTQRLEDGVAPVGHGLNGTSWSPSIWSLSSSFCQRQRLHRPEDQYLIGRQKSLCSWTTSLEQSIQHSATARHGLWTVQTTIKIKTFLFVWTLGSMVTFCFWSAMYIFICLLTYLLTFLLTNTFASSSLIADTCRNRVKIASAVYCMEKFEQLCVTIIIIIIIHEFHRDASLEQNFRAAMCHVLH